MMEILSIIVAYVIGSLPFAYLIGRWRKGVDIRQVGSRNMGAMNVTYSVGPFFGLLVLILDFAKGVLAVFLARWLADSQIVEMLAGAAAIAGHILPVFLKFKGGKGGATCIGVFFILMPWGIPVFYGIFGLLTLATRFMTLAYSIALVCFPFIAWLVYHSTEFIIYTSAILAILGIRYIPRAMQMRRESGSWRMVLLRRNLKDRI